MEQTVPSTTISTTTSATSAVLLTSATTSLLEGGNNNTDRGNEHSSVYEHKGNSYCCLRWRIKSVVTFLSSAFLILRLGGVVLGFIDIEILEKLQPLLSIIAQTSVGGNSTLLIEDGGI